MRLPYLSTSRTTMGMKCGEQYRFRYVEGVKLPPSGAMVRGSAVDAAVNANTKHKLDHGQDLPVDQVVQIAREELQGRLDREVIVWDNEDLEGAGEEKARGLITDEVVTLTRLHREKVAPLLRPRAVQLTIEMQPSEMMPVPLLGIIDVIDDSECIRDTKTSRRAAGQGAVKDSDQLTAYDLLYRARYRKAPSGLGLDQLVRTPSGKVDVNLYRDAPRDVRDLRAFAERANAVARMVETETFVPAPDSAWWCNAKWCGYHSLCKYARGRARPKS